MQRLTDHFGTYEQTEDAVIKLESVAFDQRLPGSRYRPVDSLPFFDNIPSTRMLQSASSSSHRRTKSTVAQLPETDTYAQELTPAKTSIIAFPLSFEGPYSGPSLGLPIVGSLEELRDAKKREMDSMYKMLPERELSSQLIERYFREVSSFTFLHLRLLLEVYLMSSMYRWIG